jgi:DNA-binding NarL/FixJ family response regulator
MRPIGYNSAMQTARIVLADDHAVVRSGIANAIRDLPGVAIVGEADDGPSLFTILVQTQPDCLLLDITMPSFEPIGDIGRVVAAYPAMRILVVSAYDDDWYVQGLLSVGVHGYHLKDQPLSDLRLAVQRVLAGERWICSPLVEKLLRLRESPPEGSALTSRQRELLRCLQDGLDNQAIARRTGLSIKTIENHLTRLYRQLGVQSRLEAVTHLASHPELLGRAEPAPPQRGPDQQNSRISLLIVDDNVRYRTQMRRMIGKTYPQATIHEAGTTHEALQIAGVTALQLAFVDVVLGDENGIDCARQIKAVAPNTRVVLFSAYPDREFHRRGLQAGAVAFLDKKDVNAAALRELIDDMIG